METENNLENSGREEISIGPLLKSEREKRGISRSCLSETIKIREPIIEALENEDWEKLPARVLIKGFIRSYTIAVGCDTRKAIRLFEKCVPSGGEENVRPLIRKKKKGKTIYYVITLLLLLAAVIYYLNLYGRIVVGDKTHQPENEQEAHVTETDTGYSPQTKAEEPVQTLNETFSESTTEYLTEGARPEANINEEVDQPESFQPEESTPVEKILAQVTSPPENASDTQAAAGKILTATVSMRAWVKVIADDTAPKEYIFQPGTKHSWTAERGFDVTVGNAGGVEFTFNGETSNNLGAPGEVKKLRFPDDFQTKWEE
ncbi:MAG: DUF4115 domain-containing protein [Desulfatiglans sp.]|nr:DUF4115 domain-containing protein [Desulfatiglans sp.]